MSELVIVTNNPDVAAKYPGLSSYREGSVLNIYEAVRDEVHKGAQVVSHPLSGSIKPNQTPYKSVVITNPHGPLNFASLQIIEDAISVLRRLPTINRCLDESILADFRIIDLDHISAAIKIDFMGI